MFRRIRTYVQDHNVMYMEPAHIIGVIEFMQPYKKLISYKKPSYVAEFGIGNEVGHKSTDIHHHSKMQSSCLEKRAGLGC